MEQQLPLLFHSVFGHHATWTNHHCLFFSFSFFPLLWLPCSLNLKLWMSREVFSPSFIHQVDIKCLPCARHYAGVVGLLGSRDVGGYFSSFLHSLGPEGWWWKSLMRYWKQLRKIHFYDDLIIWWGSEDERVVLM